MYGGMPGLACMLDTRFIGEGLSCQEEDSLDATFVDTPLYGNTPVDDVRRERLCMELTEFTIASRADRPIKTSVLRYSRKGASRPLQYWQVNGMSWPVHQQIALKVFSLATSGVPSERMVSTFGFVHSKLRNCLSAENVKKLVYIKTNYPNFVNDNSVLSSPEYYDDGDLSSRNEKCIGIRVLRGTSASKWSSLSNLGPKLGFCRFFKNVILSNS
jgi:hAT family C-terminal dimerisation region